LPQARRIWNVFAIRVRRVPRPTEAGKAQDEGL
jgi:hypothetical protein